MTNAKFLYMTDPHIRGKNIATRKDNFPETILKKVEDFFELGHELGVDFFVCGGDIIDTPYISNRLALKLHDLFKKGLKGKEMFFVWGNHDVIGWNPNTASDTSLGLIQEVSEFMTLLGSEVVTREYNGIKVDLTGVSSYARLDKDKEDGTHRSEDYIVRSTVNPHIHVVHGYVSPTAILEDIPHTILADIKPTKANFTLLGHEHTGFAIQQDGNQIICNPGALGRVFASRVELKRMPKYLLGTIDADGTCEAELLNCRVAEDGNAVFDREQLDKAALEKRNLELARGEIKDVLKNIDVKSVSINDILKKFESTTNPKVFNEVKKRLKIEGLPINVKVENEDENNII